MNFLTALHTDHYQWSMLFAHWRSDRESHEGSKEFFCRKMPPTRRFLVAAGIFRTLEYIQHLDFDSSELTNYLRHHPQMGPLVHKYPAFMRYVRELKADKLLVTALQDGEVFFPNEPVIRVSGPLPLLDIVETAICSILNHDVAVASKAARIHLAAQGKGLFEFGMRRTDGFASPNASLAAMIGGFHGSSNCEAGHYYEGIPIVGTMAHSFVQSYGHTDELRAFKDFLMAFGPDGTSLLIDTYDIQVGIQHAMEASRLTGVPLFKVRVDSGNPDETVPLVRAALDAQYFFHTKILVSNDMDEYKIAALHPSTLAKIDDFGVGTAVVVPPDSSSLGFVGKLVEAGWTTHSAKDTIKLSADPAKSTWPARKQIKRHSRKNADGMYEMERDEIQPFMSGSTSYSNYFNDTEIKAGEGPDTCSNELLEFISVKDAKLNIPAIGTRFRLRMLQLPEYLSSLEPATHDADVYPVTYTDSLKSKRKDCIDDIQNSLKKQREHYKL